MEMFADGIKIYFAHHWFINPAILLLTFSLFPILGSVLSLLGIVFSSANFDAATQSAKGYAIVFSFIFYLSVVYSFLIVFLLPAYMVLYTRTGKFQLKSVYGFNRK